MLIREGKTSVSGHAVVVFCQSRESSCRSRAKVYHHRRGGRLREAVTYLLLGPQELALYLSVLVQQSLVLSAQRCKAFNELVGKHSDVVLSLFGHGAVGTRVRILDGSAYRRAGEPSFDDAAVRLASGKNERCERKVGKDGIGGSHGCAAPRLVSMPSHSPRPGPRMLRCTRGASEPTAP